jgi:tellurite resistance-related uncharacterized protein
LTGTDDAARPHDLPDGLVLARVTDVFDTGTVPAGLLKTHRVAARTWGRLVVHTGSVVLAFEDPPNERVSLRAGEIAVIPPDRPHHVELSDGASFAVEFHR